ncbi:MAG: hypothetical protein K9M82_09335 [Deltaproteobacteria bacterium]|nr:hypothetical protein [Deltaproteobacteria bacterium]
MKWDAFFGRKKEARDRELEEIRVLIRRIEKTAPRPYGPERAARYYHYEQVRAYVRPLRLLLEAVADRKALSEDEGAAVRTLFLRLRDFYDVRDRLSLEEALRDVRLRRKLVHLLLIFYGRKDMDAGRLQTLLEPLREAPEEER